jgi:hypothetical protein
MVARVCTRVTYTHTHTLRLWCHSTPLHEHHHSIDRPPNGRYTAKALWRHGHPHRTAPFTKHL